MLCVMLYFICYMLYVMCYVICYMLYVLCSVFCAIYSIAKTALFTVLPIITTANIVINPRLLLFNFRRHILIFFFFSFLSPHFPSHFTLHTSLHSAHRLKCALTTHWSSYPDLFSSFSPRHVLGLSISSKLPSPPLPSLVKKKKKKEEISI